MWCEGVATGSGGGARQARVPFLLGRAVQLKAVPNTPLPHQRKRQSWNHINKLSESRCVCVYLRGEGCVTLVSGEGVEWVPLTLLGSPQEKQPHNPFCHGGPKPPPPAWTHLGSTADTSRGSGTVSLCSSKRLFGREEPAGSESSSLAGITARLNSPGNPTHGMQKGWSPKTTWEDSAVCARAA